MPDPLGGIDHTWPLIAAFVLGYLMGATPFGLLLTRVAGYGDIRSIGSGNIGATNVLRTGNRWLAVATLVLDGGKGVATWLGIMLALAWPVGLALCATWAVVAKLMRISSLAALVAAAFGPLFAWFLATPRVVEIAVFCAVMIFIRHHANIRRLIAGTEPRIGADKGG